PAQRNNSPESAMFQIGVLSQRALPDEMDCHRSDEYRADRQSQCDDDHVVGKCEGADHAVETETGIEDVEIEESAQTRADGRPCELSLVLLDLQRRVDGLDRNESDDAQDS